MSRLTKQQKTALTIALERLTAAQAYIMSPTTHIVRESRITTFPASAWTNGEGVAGIAITKEIGSDLVGVRQAASIIAKVLEASK